MTSKYCAASGVRLPGWYDAGLSATGSFPVLSYRHAFHAGNHADVLKHLVLIACLRHLGQKEKPWSYIDTHAGAGCYSLSSDWAQKTGEAEAGIARLWAQRENAPEACRPYLEAVAAFNPGSQLLFYPGSPALAITQARRQDRLRFFELHPADAQLLRQTFAKDGDRVTISESDGLSGLKACLPPPSRRALVMIDPPYERADEARAVTKALADAEKRFAQGIYAVWYPLLARRGHRPWPDLLPPSDGDWLNVRLTIGTPDTIPGMYGSGVWLRNPPWTLPDTLRSALPWIARTLGGQFTLDCRIR